eukprot:XP_011673371.1 PREDICTED: uncharacterized protein LOC105442702 [Strongylocentrotus purpuratus]
MDPYSRETDQLVDYGTFVADHSTFKQQKQRNGDEDNDDGNDDLPIAVFLALVVGGMWKPSSHPELTSLEDDLGRQKHNEDVNRERLELPDITETITTKMQTDVEDASDIDFMALKFEPSGKKKTSKRGWWNVLLESASLLYLSTLTMLLVVDGGTYLYNFWGVSSGMLYMISYVTFTLPILFGPLYALVIRLSALLPGLGGMHSCPLDMAYVLRRVRVLRSPRNRHLLKPLFMLMFIIWPLAQAILRAISGMVIHHKCHLDYFLFSDISSAWGLVAYGLFWYLIYIERASLHHDLNRVVNNVQRASLTGDVDAAHCEIRRVHRDYLILRELMGVWMAITMITTSWGLLTTLSWDYGISGQTLQDTSDRQAKLFLDITIWSEKIMFIVYPCISLGGINLEYLWQRFSHALERIQSYQHRPFWVAACSATYSKHRSYWKSRAQMDTCLCFDWTLSDSSVFMV